MTVQGQQFLRSFDLVPDSDKREVVVEILRREVAVDIPPLSDRELLDTADGAFGRLDDYEQGNVR